MGDNYTRRFLGVLAGFALGCAGWALIYFLMQGLLYVTGADHARVRVPIFFFVLPLVGAYFGYKVAALYDR